MVIRGEVEANKLENLYNICNRLIKNDDCFYTEEKLKQEKINEKNIIIKKNSGGNTWTMKNGQRQSPCLSKK